METPMAQVARPLPRLRALAICLLIACTAHAAPRKVPFPQYVRDQIRATLGAVEEHQDLPSATADIDRLFDQVILYCDNPELLRETAFAVRLLHHLQGVPEADRSAILHLARTHRAPVEHLVFLISPKLKSDDIAAAYALLLRLSQSRDRQIADYPSLTAAVCTVHRSTFEIHINENATQSPDALDVFDFYIANESRLFFGLKNVPAELLVYVVDTTAAIDDMKWALSKYAGDKAVGQHFFDIQYDLNHLRNGTPKQVTSAGFTLPNILKFGGVCADQAYFAVSIGKSIGVPTAYTVGHSAEAGHAWVGFLQTDGRKGWWNFNSGRYDAYQGVAGFVREPQTRQHIPDSHVCVLAEMIGSAVAARHNALALTDAARRLLEIENTSADTPLPPDVVPSTSRRKPGINAELALIEQALRQCAGCSDAWFAVRDFAAAGKMSMPDKRRWAEILHRLGGQKYPDFVLAILDPMIKTVPDPRDQLAMWDTAFTMFQTRADLAASIRMTQASLYEQQQKPDRAGHCYMEIIERFANSGPFVLSALTKAEAILRQGSRAEKIPLLYKQAWSQISRPQQMAPGFWQQTNYFRVGALYAAKLTEAGKSADAQQVLSQINAP